MSLRRVAGAVGIAVETARYYLAACEDASLLFSAPFYAMPRSRGPVNHLTVTAENFAEFSI